MYDPILDCACEELKVHLDRYQHDRVIQFFMGLNETYASTRDQIMLISPLRSVNCVFSMVQQLGLCISNGGDDFYPNPNRHWPR